ncbi:MAG: (d)CMP kinase [Spirochaetaceae bacterium]
MAIDGPAGSGKSTIAERCAQEVGFAYVNSGRLYRAVTLYALKNGITSDADRIVPLLSAISIEIAGSDILLNGHIVSDRLHDDEVDRWVPQHSSLPEVRTYVNTRLHDIARQGNVVVEGRDIATVVFPDAEVKVYLDASIEARAQRRYRQGTSELTYEQIYSSIEQRDELDRNKQIGRLRQSKDATYIDTSDLTIDKVCDKVLSIIHGHLESSGKVHKT